MAEKTSITENSEKLLKYPCDFLIKVMGINTDDFPRLVAGIVSEEVKSSDVSVCGVDLSKNGRYAAVSLIFTAESREQIEAVHKSLKSNSLVKVVI